MLLTVPLPSDDIFYATCLSDVSHYLFNNRFIAPTASLSFRFEVSIRSVFLRYYAAGRIVVITKMMHVRRGLWIQSVGCRYLQS